MPALRALRAALPEAHITLIGLPWAGDVVRRFRRYLDAFLEFPGYPGLPEQQPRVRLLEGFFERACSERFDLAIQLHGSGTITNQVVSRLGARVTAGFYPPEGLCPDPATFLPYPEDVPEPVRLLRLLEHLGARPLGTDLEFPLGPDDYDSLRPLARETALDQNAYICIHPGARDAARRWPALRFAAVADALARRGFRVVLTGSRTEIGLAEDVLRAMTSAPVNLAGRTSLGALGALIAGARLLICNDTGVSHLAAALHTPSVVIFSASDPARWAPLDTALHPAIGGSAAAPAAPDAVLAAAERLLDAAPVPSAASILDKGGRAW